MTGHQQLVNDVKFSPDTRIIASASFDKSIRLWSGLTGKYALGFTEFVCYAAFIGESGFVQADKWM